MVRNVFRPFFYPHWEDYKNLSCKSLVLEVERKLQASLEIAIKDLEEQVASKTTKHLENVYQEKITPAQILGKLRLIQTCRPYSDYTIQLDDDFKEKNKLNPCDNSNLCPWCHARRLDAFISELKSKLHKDVFVQSYALKFPLAKDCMAWELLDPVKAFSRLIEQSKKTDMGMYIVMQDWFNHLTDMDRVKDNTHYRPRKTVFHTFTRAEHELKDLMECGDLRSIYAPNGSKRISHKYIDKEELYEEIPKIIQFEFANVYENWPKQLPEFLALYHNFSSFGGITSQKYNDKR